MFANTVRHSTPIAAIIASAVIASGVEAQGTITAIARAAPAREDGRGAFSLSAIQGRPQGAFGRNIGLGYGVDGAYLLRLDAAGIWSLRAGVGAISYGGESRREAFSETVGGRVAVDVITANYIVPLSVGPQVSWPRGWFRPYANVGLGAQVFFTESSVRGTASSGVLASSTNHSSAAASWTFGGGVTMPLYAERSRIDLDLGVQFVRGGTARYLATGSIVDLPGARVTVTPMESRTDIAIIRLGARVRP